MQKESLQTNCTGTTKSYASQPYAFMIRTQSCFQCILSFISKTKFLFCYQCVHHHQYYCLLTWLILTWLILTWLTGCSPSSSGVIHVRSYKERCVWTRKYDQADDKGAYSHGDTCNWLLKVQIRVQPLPKSIRLYPEYCGYSIWLIHCSVTYGDRSKQSCFRGDLSVVL